MESYQQLRLDLALKLGRKLRPEELACIRPATICDSCGRTCHNYRSVGVDQHQCKPCFDREARWDDAELGPRRQRKRVDVAIQREWEMQ